MSDQFKSVEIVEPTQADFQVDTIQTEEPHPYLCIEHGGSPACEEENRKSGFSCPKCNSTEATSIATKVCNGILGSLVRCNSCDNGWWTPGPRTISGPTFDGPEPAQPEREPRTWWVNEYDNGCLGAEYDTKEEADANVDDVEECLGVLELREVLRGPDGKELPTKREEALEKTVAVYKKHYSKALEFVDTVFQDEPGSKAILGDYCKLGEHKFEAVVRLAEDYKEQQARISGLEQQNAKLRHRMEDVESECDESEDDELALRKRCANLEAERRASRGDNAELEVLREFCDNVAHGTSSGWTERMGGVRYYDHESEDWIMYSRYMSEYAMSLAKQAREKAEAES